MNIRLNLKRVINYAPHLRDSHLGTSVAGAYEWFVLHSTFEIVKQNEEQRDRNNSSRSSKKTHSMHTCNIYFLCVFSSQLLFVFFFFFLFFTLSYSLAPFYIFTIRFTEWEMWNNVWMHGLEKGMETQSVNILHPKIFILCTKKIYSLSRLTFAAICSNFSRCWVKFFFLLSLVALSSLAIVVDPNFFVETEIYGVVSAFRVCLLYMTYTKNGWDDYFILWTDLKLDAFWIFSENIRGKKRRNIMIEFLVKI